ncbi:MAG TPA: hypothetical protein DCE78_02330 [Bacteroidetes bacterium]|nr:hypothetical protein [Bacteroidota bacterium]
MSVKMTLWSTGTPVVTWWNNFYCQHNTGIGSLSEIDINQILKEHYAKYVIAYKEIYVEFEDEQYASMFILKYS